jgi:hypothetical protein
VIEEILLELVEQQKNGAVDRLAGLLQQIVQLGSGVQGAG